MHDGLVKRLGGLGLPRKSVVRLIDRSDMTLDVYRGRKTTMQQQQNSSHLSSTVVMPSSSLMNTRVCSCLLKSSCRTCSKYYEFNLPLHVSSAVSHTNPASQEVGSPEQSPERATNMLY